MSKSQEALMMKGVPPDKIDWSRIPGRLTVYDRDEIRAAFKAGVPAEQMSQEYNRSPATIRRFARQDFGV